ncbi:MAG TPA: hypothetical protein VHE53_03055 [Patescibacteria group bacterium]|nr:hypothetical protein [Patescibacteria group bacterium]
MSRTPEVPDYNDRFFVDGKDIKLTNGEKAAMILAAAIMTTIAIFSSGDKKGDYRPDPPFNQRPNYHELYQRIENTREIQLTPHKPSTVHAPYSK